MAGLLFYSVIIPRNPNDDCSVRNFTTLEEARQTAVTKKGLVFEFNDKPLQPGEVHSIRGRLIASVG